MMFISRLAHLTKQFSKTKYDESLKVLTEEYKRLLKTSDDADEHRQDKMESILEKIDRIRQYKEKEKIKQDKKKELEVVK